MSARSRGRAAVLISSLALAACGGHAVTKHDVIARANAICASSLRAVRSVAPPPAGQTSVAALSSYLQRVLPIVEREDSDTRSLPRPAQDRSLLNRYVAAVTAAATQYRAVAAAAARNDPAAVAQGLATLRDNPAPGLAERYGLTQCGVAAGTGVS